MKAKRQQQQRAFVCAKAKRQRQQQQEVGHEGVITGHDAFSLRFSIVDPQEVAQPPSQSTYTHDAIPKY